jgi:hypothetical protein
MLFHDKASLLYIWVASPLNLFSSFPVFHQTNVQTFSADFARFLVDRHLTNGIQLQQDKPAKNLLEFHFESIPYLKIKE